MSQSAAAPPSPMALAAMGYARAGYRVFPLHSVVDGMCSCRRRDCDRPGKHPRIANGLNGASTDAKQVERWWRQWPDAPIGLRTGDGFFVVDLDGEEGKRRFAELVKRHGGAIESARSFTGGGGIHIWFRTETPVQNSVSRMANKVDVRGEGGYVVAPPSLHASGRRYAWDQGADLTMMSDAPAWLVELANKKPEPKRPASGGGGVDGEASRYIRGGRNNALASLAGTMRRRGMSVAAILAALLEENASSCVPPLDELEVRRIAESVGRYAPNPDAKPRAKQQSADAASGSGGDGESGETMPPGGPESGERGAGSSDGNDDQGAAGEGEGDGPTRVESGERWTDLLTYKHDDRGRPTSQLLSSISNAALIFSHDPEWVGVLAFDQFFQRVVVRKPPPVISWAKPSAPREGGLFGEGDYARARVWLEQRYSLHLPKETICEAIGHVVAPRASFHPVREYLERVAKTWDGQPRLDTVATTYFGSSSDSPFVRWFMTSAVARVFRPGSKADAMLILEGEQGRGKSTAIKVLAAPWVSDSPLQIGTKDAFIALQGTWIVEVAELESILRSDPDSVKAFLSSSTDRYRPPYARDAEDFPRQCVFWGTVNRFEYLKDPTGARRFWPILCTRIELDALERDRDQLWGEAMALYFEGRAWWPQTEAETSACEVAQEARYAADVWEAPIRTYLLAPQTETETEGVTAGEVLTKAIHLKTSDQDRKAQSRVQAVLERLGLRPGRPRRHDGSRPRAYLPLPGAWPPPWASDQGRRGEPGDEGEGAPP